MSLDECYHVLGIPRSASAAEVTAAFRRLAKQHHPDVSHRHAGHRRFVEVATAYSVLRERLRDRRPGSRRGECPYCHRYADLYAASGGVAGCADCLLGRTYRSRFLPLPVVVVARHSAVFTLYAVCILYLLLYLRTGDWHHALTSLLAVTAGMGVLASEVLSLVPRAQSAERLGSRQFQRRSAG
jgi:hypothetical protein